ncbi:MAG: histidine phosphatase family protein [Promethearchaeota archaeon]|jgi:broad specificity phosphatase PhoE
MQLILIRHGESISNAKKQLQGHYDSPLSEKGTSQAQALNRVFKRLNYNFTSVYSSDLQRAAHTAKIITQDIDSPGIIFSSLLRELDLGILAKRYDHSLSELEKAELATLWVDYNSKIEGGESINQLINRNRSILRRILSREGNGGRILIVSHGGAIYTILCRILMFKINVDEWLKNCQINELLYNHQTGRMKLIKINGDQLKVPQETENRI